MTSFERINAYAQLTRPQNASGSVLTYAIGYFFVTNVWTADLFIGLGVLLALHALATVQNDIEDFEIDRANHRKGVLQAGLLPLAQAQLLVRALGVAAVIFACLSSRRALHLSAVVSLLLLSWLYNSAPVKGSKRPLFSIILLGICYGALPFGYGALVGGGPLNLSLVILSSIWFVTRFSTAIMKDYKDVRGDKAFHKQTFYLQYGARLTAWTSLATAITGYAGALAMVLVGEPTSMLFFVAFGTAVALAIRSMNIRRAILETKREARLSSIFHKSVMAHNQFEAAVLLCLLVS